MSVSDLTLKSGLKGEDLVKKEAISMCRNNIWASFLCVLALSSVLQHKISLHYPEFGKFKYSIFFNQSILPRRCYCDPSFIFRGDINILFCQLSKFETEKGFEANHFVPLIRRFLKRPPIVSDSISTKKKKSTILHSNSPFLGKKSIYDFFKKSNPKSFSNTLTSRSSLPTSFSVASTTTTNSLIITTSCNTATVTTTSCVSSISSIVSSVLPSSFSSSSSNTTTTTSAATTTNNDNSSIITTNTSFSVAASCSHSTLVSKYDISTYFEKSKVASETELHDLIKNVFIPDTSYSFAKTKGKRNFRYDWLVRYPWLKYSPSTNGCFCLPCILFSHRATSKLRKSQNLILKPIFPSAEATTIFNRHESARDGIHSFCMHAFQTFLQTFSGKSLPVYTMVDNIRRQKVLSNRAVLSPIIDTIILCGHLGIPLRGHRDDSSNFPEAGQYCKVATVGNFVELINFGIRRGDSTLEEHYKKHSKNVSYLSKTTQNDLISCCGKVISDEILQEIKLAKYFSILADEAMDSSGKEQLSLVIRYVDSSNNIKEDFLGFIHLNSGLSGKALSDTILNTILDLGLDISNCRGQGYDGAGSVAGVRNGCAAHITRINKKAVYTHCFSHRLNLAVAKGFKIVSVSNMMELIQKISDFFRHSEQRQLAFQKYVLEYAPHCSKSKLKDPCKTRWIERIKDLDLFIDLFEPLWMTLDIMRNNLSREFNLKTQNDAFSFFKGIDSFDFIANLFITYKVLELTLLVTQLLQSKKNDIADGIHLIESLINRVNYVRSNVESYHNRWYEEISEIAGKLNILETKPRTNKRQIFRDNHPSDSVKDFYKVSLTIPLLDSLVQDLKTRFSENSLVSYTGLHLIPSNVVRNHQGSKKALKDLCKSFFEFYEDEFPYPRRIEAELELWEEYWVNHKELCPNNASSTLKAVDFEAFHNIKIALSILATIPITSCECERSFSGMRRLKSYLRSTMVADRLDGLALLNFHLDRVPSVNKVINKFAGRKERRLELDL